MSFSSTSTRENLEGSLTVLSVIREASNRVTDLVRNICRKLGLDTEIKVSISLKLFEERDMEGDKDEIVKAVICGYYDPNRKLVVISLPCVISRGTIVETLAHELVHHCQFACFAETCKEICTVSLNPEETEEIREMLPYSIRPHEVEAYNSEAELAQKIKNFEEFRGIEELVRRLHNTLNYRRSGPICASKTILATIKLLDSNIIDAINSSYSDATSRLLRCLNLDKPTLTSTPSTEDFIKMLLDNIHVNLLVLIPEKETYNGHEIMREAIYVLTDKGFALYTIDVNTISLYPLLIIPTEKISLKDVLSGEIKISLTYDQIARGYTDLIISNGRNIKSRVIIDIGNKVLKEFRELCSDTKSLSFAELGLLMTLCPNHEFKNSQLRDFNANAFKVVCDIEIGGFVFCNNVKLEGMQRDVKIKELFEELKRC